MRLAGYSSGCQIGYRIALTLESTSNTVALVLLDGRLPALFDGSAFGITRIYAYVEHIMAVLSLDVTNDNLDLWPRETSDTGVQALAGLPNLRIVR